jgi:peptide/nickel transport system substrate-binding protein
MVTRHRPELVLFWVLLLAALSMGACTGQFASAPTTIVPTTPTPTPQPTGRGAGGTLRLLHWQAPDTLNPHLTAFNQELEISRLTYEPLASFDSENNMVLFLAAEEPTLDNDGVAADGKSVTWKLRQDVKWSDGEPFTADDVLFTYEFISNEAVNSPSLLLYETIESVEVIDDYTVRINFEQVNPAWAIPFVGLQGSILPRHVFEAYNGANARSAPANTMPVGTGPYRVLEPGIKPQEVLFLGTELIQTVKIVYEPNPFYREEDKPFFRRVELKGGGTASEAARAVLAAGEIDYAFNLQLDPDILDEMAVDGQGHVVANFGARVEQIVVNHSDPNRTASTGEVSSIEFEHPTFSDKRVRQALAYAIDRQAIADLYGATGQATSNNLVAPANYVSPNAFYEFDPVKARLLLEEAGWSDSDDNGIRDKDGQPLELLSHAAVSSLQQQSQQIIQRNLRDVGIDVDVRLLDASVFFGDPATNRNSVFRFPADLESLDISSESPDPGSYMQYWVCDQIPQQSNGWAGINMGRWCNENYDDLFDDATTEIEPQKRRNLFIEMNDLQVEDVAMIPLVHLARVAGVNNRIEGVSSTPWDADVWNIHNWRSSSE